MSISASELRAMRTVLDQGLARGVDRDEILRTLWSMFRRWYVVSTESRAGGGRKVQTALPAWLRDMGDGTVKCKRCGARRQRPEHFTGFKCRKCNAPWWDNELIASGGRIIEGQRYTAEELGPDRQPLVVKPEAD